MQFVKKLRKNTFLLFKQLSPQNLLLPNWQLSFSPGVLLIAILVFQFCGNICKLSFLFYLLNFFMISLSFQCYVVNFYFLQYYQFSVHYLVAFLQDYWGLALCFQQILGRVGYYLTLFVPVKLADGFLYFRREKLGGLCISLLWFLSLGNSRKSLCIIARTRSFLCMLTIVSIYGSSKT